MKDDDLLDTLCRHRLERRGWIVRRPGAPPEGYTPLGTAEIDRIKMAVAARFGFTVRDLLSRARSGSVVKARQIAMYIARQITQLSSMEIGEEFLRDHGTILWACKIIEAEVRKGGRTAEIVKEIIANLHATERIDTSNSLR